MAFHLLATWLTLSVVAQPPADTGLGIRSAVVNVALASERYLRTAELEAQFDARRQRFKEEANARQDEIDKKGRALQEQLKPGTEAYAQRQEELAMLQARLQYFAESTKQELDAALAAALRSIYTDIQQAVREVAQENGYDVVLAADELPANVPPSPKLATQEILWQKVVYWNPGIDITADVIARLNARYAAQSGGNGSAPLP
ncbi:MAG: OmpH family outer membrane protein [Phycisphaerae bacterium]